MRPTPWISDITYWEGHEGIKPQHIAEMDGSLSLDRCDWIAGMNSLPRCDQG